MDIVTKTFRAPNMLLALQQVQRDLGSDAIVVSMRKVPSGPAWQVWREPMVEVIAMKNAGQATTLTAENKKQIAEKLSLSKSESNISPSVSTSSEKKSEHSSSSQKENKKDEVRKNQTPRPAANVFEVLNQYQAQTQPISLQDLQEEEIFEGKDQDEVIVSSSPAVANDELKQELRKLINTLTSNPVENEKIVPQSPAPEQPHWKPFIPPKVTLNKGGQTPQQLSKTKIEQSPTEIKTNEQEITPEFSIAPPLPKALASIRDQMIAQELEVEFVDQMIDTCLDILPQKARNDRSRIRTILQRQFEAEIRTLSIEECFSAKNIFLVGSSGAGKTSSCAKLSAYALHSLEKQVHWICADTIRASALAEARTFTDLLSIPLKIAYTPEDLERTLKTDVESDFMMIDTMNCNPRSEASIVEVGNFITQASSRTTFMVVSATTKPVDLKQALAAFRPFRIKGLLVTKLDESLTFGSIYNIAWQSQMPLCFYSCGTHVFNDLLPASSQSLVDSLFGEGFAK